MNKVVLVTGAADGIGYEIASHFIAQQDYVIVSDITLEKAESAVQKLVSKNAYPVKLDIRDEEDFVNVLQWIRIKFQHLDVLVNNAAMTQTTSLFEISAAEFNEMTDTNQKGTFLSCKIFGQFMATQGFGRIINMSSLAGQNGGVAVGAHYAISEGAILSLTKIFAKALATSGVTVNAIACGPVDSPAFHRLVNRKDIPKIIEAIPVKQLGSMHFISQAISLLSQENAGFVTGATWDMNGGLLMR